MKEGRKDGRRKGRKEGRKEERKKSLDRPICLSTTDSAKMTKNQKSFFFQIFFESHLMKQMLTEKKILKERKKKINKQ